MENLSKRELIAAMAMQGMLSSPHITDLFSNRQDVLSRDAVCYADALLRELKMTEDSSSKETEALIKSRPVVRNAPTTEYSPIMERAKALTEKRYGNSLNLKR